MKRKKFIKMLMWAGMPRNMAGDCAQLAQEAQRPYDHVLGDLLNKYRHLFTCPWLLNIMGARAAIIHGNETPAGRFFQLRDEWDAMDCPDLYDVIKAGMAERPRPAIITGIDVSTGTDYGCEVKGHAALAPDGREILVIDEMHLLQPLIKNEGELLLASWEVLACEQ